MNNEQRYFEQFVGDEPTPVIVTTQTPSYVSALIDLANAMTITMVERPYLFLLEGTCADCVRGTCKKDYPHT